MAYPKREFKVLNEPRKKRGRPRKTDVAKKRKPGVPGRPKGEAAVMKDYKARMLASPKSRKVLDKIFEAALNDEHKNQASAWKIITERIMPVSMFEKEVGSEGGRPTVNITIGTVGNVDFDNNDKDDNDPIDGNIIDNEE